LTAPAFELAAASDLAAGKSRVLEIRLQPSPAAASVADPTVVQVPETASEAENHRRLRPHPGQSPMTLGPRSSSRRSQRRRRTRPRAPRPSSSLPPSRCSAPNAPAIPSPRRSAPRRHRGRNPPSHRPALPSLPGQPEKRWRRPAPPPALLPQRRRPLAPRSRPPLTPCLCPPRRRVIRPTPSTQNWHVGRSAPVLPLSPFEFARMAASTISISRIPRATETWIRPRCAPSPAGCSRSRERRLPGRPLPVPISLQARLGGCRFMGDRSEEVGKRSILPPILVTQAH
jgi:hypothetical protein